MTESDAARFVRLLWRVPEPSRRGPKSRLDVDTVVAAAIRIADAEGLAAATIRRIAEEVGASRMAVYTYADGKERLLDLMTDAVNAEVHAAGPIDQPWPQSVRELADRNLAAHRAHPWLTDAPLESPVLGPGTVGKYETELAVFDGLGLDDVPMDLCLNQVLGFVRGTARDEAARRPDPATPAQWWADYGAALAAVIDPADYPLASRVGTAAGEAMGAAHDGDAAYVFGLDRLVDGLVRYVDQVRSESS
ncbi:MULTISPECIES: TetR/AcrR family transcriptional regulator [Tsukamurella]|uniref:TetR/AcrR family transcriptional regulator n=1 Tax=Tsukamurella strandjordii TaxID=147577 RepID=A0AA90N6P0_9ACTN|nr:MULTISPECIES: TetR/AcrR family transcriptional regulator [Tsukamurella]MDP0396541.1 TetR/AcrR family transcriptional regulator [Tsukamurella strandjordii]GIZ96346.1 TetR family transcriptional regulator [Tsukamurella sp. TY48]